VKTVLFCNLPYSFAILRPIEEYLQRVGYDYIWYIPEKIVSLFPYSSRYTTLLKEVKEFSPDAIFVPGNSVPYRLNGVKVQIFHGFAGEKKGHFRIRDYFDLYLTQGPLFTREFKKLSEKYGDFKVVETGWSKLDFRESSGRDKHILYAPTFSPSLTSATELLPYLQNIDNLVIKFHDKMDSDTVEMYRDRGLKISDSRDITPLLQNSKVVISDTSSAVYEALLMDIPVLTLNSRNSRPEWGDFSSPDRLIEELKTLLSGVDNFKTGREKIKSEYHPYSDGRSSERMVKAVENYIEEFGVPSRRELPLLRKLKNIREFGLI
jgi:hypothetical protein